LPNGLSAWLANGHKIEQHWIDKESALREALRFSKLAADQDSPLAAVDSSSRHLYDLLIKPFAEKLPSRGVLVIDAEGPLASIPWLALEDTNSRPILERFAVSQTVGWQEASARPTHRRINFRKTLILAEPSLGNEIDQGQYPSLIQAMREAETLKRRVPTAIIFPGRKATLKTLTASIPHSTVFYFAGHGISYGGFGALLLAPALGQSPVGLLTSKDILQLDLRSLQLVVLSACSSGVGEQYGVIDLDSLVRAFLEAGALRVVAARWNVKSQETADLMRPFLDLVLDGQRPAEALRQAAMAIRQNPLNLHPYYWAGFQVFGAP
jgi:CHAT domain-containing protein